MSSYWPDNKAAQTGHRGPLNKIFYRLYLRFGLRSNFWVRFWSEPRSSEFCRFFPANRFMRLLLTPKVANRFGSSRCPRGCARKRYPLNTCLLRGWIEILDVSGQSYEKLTYCPASDSQRGGSFDDFSKPPYYRMTTAGWNAFYRHYAIARIALAISLLALTISATVAVTTGGPRTETPTLKGDFPRTPAAMVKGRTSFFIS